jgi:predicted acylesterase/phospholipase RssA
MDIIAHIYGGGSIKGIWQMGAINNVIGRGVYPDILTGISVGNLNANLLANKVGEHYIKHPNKSVDWDEVNNYLKDFWFNNITCPDDIAYKKSAIKLVWELLRGNFNGFSDTTPLRKLINETIDSRNVLNSKLKVSSGCVNIEEGKIIYTNPQMANYNKYVLASSSIPFMMPVEEIGQLKFIDGGLVDSAPIGQAIKMGATKLIVFANHPEKVGHRTINHNNPLVYADRLMEIIVNNTLNNDIMEAQLINELLKDGVKCKRTENKKVIDIKVIRPKTRIDLKIDKFTKEDIKNTWQMGWDIAEGIKM